MSYVVLARKYRPRTFAQMVGQEHVVQALSNALLSQRLHHAYLFTGTRGIGKTTVSRILAKSLNCTGPDGSGGITAEPCGVCSACVQIDADRYLDYTELDAASNRSIDEIRDLIERAAYKPGVGRFKVFMIDEAHQLTKDAFNALLKTLEEPPDYLKFVLATTDPDKMLPTVLSRCLQFNLRPMAPATVREHLAHVLAAEQVAFDDGALRLLARAARGSMRDGLSLTDQAIAYGGGRLSEDGVRSMLGSVDRGHARALVQALAARDGAAVLAAVDGLRALGLSAAGTLEEIALLLQQMAVEQAVPGALDAQDPDTEDARALHDVLAADETQLLYSMALRGRDELSLMSDEYGALTMVLLRFLAFPAQAGGVPAGPPDGARRAAQALPQARPGDAAAHGAPAAPVRPAVAGPTAAAATLAAAAMPAAAAAAPPGRDAREARVAPLRAAAPPAISLPAPEPVSALAPVLAPPRPGPGAQPVAAAAVVSRAVDGNAALPARWAVGPQSPAPHACEPAPPPFINGPDPALGDRWYALVKALCDQGALSALARELALQAGLQAIDTSASPPCWRLLVERETLRTPALRDKLAALLAATLGQPLQLDLQAGVPGDSPARRDAAERQRRQAAAEAAIHNDPLVRDLLTQFKSARIVPGSIKPV